MNAAKIIRQLQKASDETFVAAGKFISRDGVVGTTLGGPLAGAIAADEIGAIATRDSGHKTKERSGAEIPRVVYVGVTDSEVILVNGSSRRLLGPTRRRRVLARWRRSEVQVIATSRAADIVAEFYVPDVDRPMELVCGRLDGSAKNVVRLLSSHNHAHDRLSPVDTDAVAPPPRQQTSTNKKS